MIKIANRVAGTPEREGGGGVRYSAAAAGLHNAKQFCGPPAAAGIQDLAAGTKCTRRGRYLARGDGSIYQPNAGCAARVYRLGSARRAGSAYRAGWTYRVGSAYPVGSTYRLSCTYPWASPVG